MSRKAGEALMALARHNPELAAIIAGGILAGTTPAVLGAVDLATGDTNLMNSGEVGVNPLLALLPALGATVGAGAGTLANKDARQLAGFTAMAWMKDKNNLSQDEREFGTRVVQQMEGDKAAYKRFLVEREAQGKRPLTDEEQMATFLKRSMYGRAARGAGAAALIGSVAGAIPAVMAMRDNNTPVQVAPQ